MKTLTATHVKYYHLCHRKLWLFDRDVWMEHTSEAVAAGELLHQTGLPPAGRALPRNQHRRQQNRLLRPPAQGGARNEEVEQDG